MRGKAGGITWQIVRADARALPLADASVDLIVTSPPYWGLRSYRDDGEHYAGQIGSESTPAAFVEELVSMIDGEWRRVLKPSGSMMLNLGDKYHSSPPGRAQALANSAGYEASRHGSHRDGYGIGDARPKSLLGLPWRVALALIDRGWILRSEIIWAKPNGLPESVQDRVRRSHEQVFHFTLEPRYYSAVDRIRERYEAAPAKAQKSAARAAGATRNPGIELDHDLEHNPLGRLPGSVWTIPTSPLIIPDSHRQHWNLPDHYAAYPPELVRRIVLGWSPEKVCQRCGEGRRPVVDKRLVGVWHDKPLTTAEEVKASSAQGVSHLAGWFAEKPFGSTEATVVGEHCACPTPDHPTRPGVCLDPMCGTGTTVGVAHKLGRHAIGTDLSHDYCRLAEWRVGVSDHFDRIDDRTAAEAQLTLGGTCEP